MDPQGDGSLGRVESVEGQDGEGDGQQEGQDEKNVGGGEGLAEKPVPAELGMRCSKHAQGEEEHDDVDDEDADVREDECCNGEFGIRWSGCRREPQYECANTTHAETEQCPRHEKFVARSSIQPIDGHVRDGTNQVDEDEDSADGYVLVNSGMAADTGNSGRDVWWL